MKNERHNHGNSIKRWNVFAEFARLVKTWRIAISIFPALLACLSCNDFFVSDISNGQVTNLIPGTGWSSHDSTLFFSWSTVEGATEYNYILVSPSFGEVHELIIDSVLNSNNLKLSLAPGRYEWKVRGQNSVFESAYTSAGFELFSPLANPELIRPANNDTIETEVVQFSWSYPYKAQDFVLELFTDSDLDSLVQTKETNDTTIYLELKTSGQYFWKLSLKDQSSTGKHSFTSTFHLDLTNTTNISEERVTLRAPDSTGFIANKNVSFWWDEIEGATNYTLQVVSPDFSNTNQLLLDVKLDGNSMTHELEEGNYQWRVKASNKRYSTAYTTSSFKIYGRNLTNELVSLNSPVDESIIRSSKVNFEWETFDNAEYQFILKKDSWESGQTLHQKTVNENIQNYTLTDGLYFWGVKAKDLINSSETEYSTSSFTIDLTSPGKPIHVNPLNNSVHEAGEIQFQWSPEDEGDSDLSYAFELYVQNGSLKNLVYSTETVSRGLSYVLDKEGTYFWQLSATDQANNSSGFSSFSSFRIANENDISNEAVSLYAPYNGIKTSNKVISFWWEQIDKAESYVFQLVKPNFTNVEELVKETIIGENKTSVTLQQGQYQWRVKATNSNSETDFSEVYSLTIE